MEMQPVDHLIAAVLVEDAGGVTCLLAADPRVREARSMFGVGAVHAARCTGATELVRLLLPDGPRDAVLAAELGAVDRVEAALQELLDAGADAATAVTDGPHAGQTAADMALGQGHLVLAARLDTGAAEVASPYG